MQAHLRHIRIAPRKVNVVASMVRKLPVTKALESLKFLPKAAAEKLYKVIHSALSNAKHNDKKNEKDLVIGQIVVNEGRTLKRGMPISRGRHHRILKRSSHVTVTLEEISS